MSYARQFARHAAITVATTIVTGVLFYVLRIVLYANLTPEEYGLFYTLFAFVTIVQAVVTFGFDPGLVPYITDFRERNDFGAMKSLVLGALIPQALATILVAVVFLTLPGYIAPLLTGEQAGAGLLRILAAHAVFVLLFKAGQQLLLGVQAIAWRNASDLARAIICVGGAAVLLRMGWGVYATAIAYTLGAASEVIVQIVAVRVVLPDFFRARFTLQPDLVRRAFNSGKWLSIAFGGISIFSAIDTLYIAYFLSSRDVAAYQIALPTISILHSLMIAAGLTLLPTVRTLWLREERELLRGGIERLYRTAVALVLPTGVLLACSSDILMQMLFRKDILNADDAFNVLAIGSLAFFVCYINLHILAGIDESLAAGIAVLGGLITTLALSALLTPLLGIRGAALADVSGFGVCAVLGLYAIRTRIGLAGLWKPILASSGVAACAGIAAVGLRIADWLPVDRPAVAAVVNTGILAVALALLELIGILNFWQALRTIFPTLKRPADPRNPH